MSQRSLAIRNEALFMMKQVIRLCVCVQFSKLKTRSTDNCIQQGAAFTKKRQATFLTKCVVLTKRSVINMHRDMGYYWLRFGIYIAICVSIGTIFFNVGYGFASIQVSSNHSIYILEHDEVFDLSLDFQARASMLMFTSTLLTMMSIGGFPSFVEDMKVKNKKNANYQ